MESMSGVTVFGITMVILYAITKIFNFYGVGINEYGSYLTFYIFLLILIFFTPNYHTIH
jgi:hypothetical protein